MIVEFENTIMIEQFHEIMESGDKSRLFEFLDEQNISDVAKLVDEYPEYEQEIIDHLDIHRAASTFKILDLPTQKRVMRDLRPSKMAELLNELPADDRTYFFEELPSSIVRELIKQLNPDERKITLSLMGYPEDSVGRLMTPDYVYVFENNTIEEVLETIRKIGKNSETIDVIYVINDKGELLDDIRIREFILNPPYKKVTDLMDERRVIALNAYDDQEKAYQAFKMNNRVALPVVSNSNKLLGIVTIDDVLWVASEEFSKDIQKIGGAEALNEPYLDIPLLRLIQKRAGWLVALFISEMLTASAMQHYQETGIFIRFAYLILFIPLITSSGGNSGSQASSLIIQAMALGEVGIRDWWRVMRRELMSGFSLGFILGLIGFIRVTVWQLLGIADYGAHWMLMATIIFFALLGVIMWGGIIGSMLPIVLKKFRQDPATSSAPFVATLVDVTGIVIYCSVAIAILKQIS